MVSLVPAALAAGGFTDLEFGLTLWTVVLFAIGLMAGMALGMIIVGFLAIGAYDRGFTDALQRRKAWRTELVARTVVGTRALAATRKAS